MAIGRAAEKGGHYLGWVGLSAGITFDTLDTGSAEGNSYTVSRGQYILCLDMMVDTVDIKGNLYRVFRW